MSETFNEGCFQHFPLPVSSLPRGWECVSLGDIAQDINSGFSSGKHSSDGSGIPHLRPMNIDRDGTINLSVLKSVVSTQGIELAAREVLFNNTNSAELVGKTALISSREQGYAFSNHMTRIRLESDIAAAFVARQLHFLWMSGYFRHRCTNHVNQASISSKTLANTMPLLLPPVREQERIVEKLEEVLSDLDAGVAELKAAQKKLVLYRQSLLKAAVDGSLTASWREAQSQSLGEPQETGAQLLERILTQRRASWEAKQLAKYAEQDKTPPADWKRKYVEPLAPNADGLPSLPLGWLWVSLDQILCDLRSGTAETSGRDATPHPVLKSSAVRQAKIDFEALNYLREDQSQRRDNYLMLGDVLITRLSGSVEYVGCCAVVDDLPVTRVQYPDRIFCGKLSPSLMWLGDYLVCCFRSPYIRERLEAAAKSTAGHKRISLSDLYPLPIPLPPGAEIREIVMQTSDALQRADDADYAIEIGLKQSAAQRQNILKAAFSGQLVPQDPSDEPAAVLLERIRAERAAAGTGSGKRGRKPRALS